MMSSTVDLLTTNVFDNSWQYRHNASNNKILLIDSNPIHTDL